MSGDSPDALVRVHVVYSGRVQGVGFRMTTRDLGERSAITGWVRNVPDGTVEMEAQGSAEAIAQFLDSIAREFGAFMLDQVVSPLAVEVDEPVFEIRR